MNLREFKKINATFCKPGNTVPAGVGCLASIIRYFGSDVSLRDLIKYCNADKGGVSLQGLMDAARSAGFHAEGYEGEVSFLKEFYQPVILIVINDTGNESCIVLYGWQNGKFIIGEPSWGILEYREDELEAVWKSRAFLLIRPRTNYR
jgi:ATP-binding cassette, subfamily C, bacteriocin exporter